MRERNRETEREREREREGKKGKKGQERRKKKIERDHMMRECHSSASKGFREENFRGAKLYLECIKYVAFDRAHLTCFDTNV